MKQKEIDPSKITNNYLPVSVDKKDYPDKIIELNEL